MNSSPVDDSCDKEPLELQDSNAWRREPLELRDPGVWRTIFGIIMTGPGLPGLGASQAIYGWAGEALFMRIGYPTVSIQMRMRDSPAPLGPSQWFATGG
ncbi:hypothetical protein [Lignipirellula cremea]|uniref:Uncharacterized protein n=1 Tax=Lignipirellula cremea TaxID=2528010 RepID=A0A518E0U7_9BACT|nr:hypothetical protein [Lignipirellula cremea]QDU97712.1 hypothetical protein Pla8534_55650 [Lignipirellula cremea]